MKLNIQNIGVVKEADINIDGLTVICGENDTGKSTIGKTLFALVKGIIGYEEDFQSEISYELATRFRQIHRVIEQEIDLSQLDDEQIGIIHRHIPISSLFLAKQVRSGKLQYNDFLPFIDLLKKLHNQEIISSDTYDRLSHYIKDIEFFLRQEINPSKKQKIALERAFFSEFQTLITDESKVYLVDNDVNELMIEFNKKSKIKNELSNLEDFYFGEITYIETPAVVQFFKLIMSAGVKLPEQSRRRIQETVPLHTKDLTRKLFNSDSIFNNEAFYSIHKMIYEAIQGDFVYDNRNNDFYLNRNGKTIPSMDIASGIKSLGIIDILIKNGILNPNDLLILDEPEINLHPEWQNKYAEIICMLVECGVKVLVVTHSPYMVSALHHFSKNNDAIKRNFYLAEKDENGSYFSDETNNVMGGIVKRFAYALEGMY